MNGNNSSFSPHYGCHGEETVLLQPSKTKAPFQQHPLNQSSNVLLVYRLEDMRSTITVNFLLAILCLMYCGINAVLIVVNYLNSHAASEEEFAVDDLTFHLLEFWATFIFALVECASLVSSPKSLVKIYNNPVILKLILFFNIVATSVPAALITLNKEVFEIASHEIEYLNELTMTFVDIVFLWSVLQLDAKSIRGQLTVTGCAGVVALIQIGIYNGMGRQPNGDMRGEVPAHYFEFVFEIMSSFVAFWFCMDNVSVAQEEIGLILYGQHDSCKICGDKNDEFEKIFKAPVGEESSYGN